MLIPLMDAFEQLDIVSLRQREPPNDGNDSDESPESFLVADNVSMATWNAFAKLDRLPHGLQLRQLLWVDDEVFIVQAVIGPAHELAASWIDRRIGNALGDDGGAPRTMNFTTPSQPDYQADCCFRHRSSLPGLVVPQGIQYIDWLTLVVEIMHGQGWDSVIPKIAVYRQRVGIQYILCVRMSDTLNRWTYELYDVPNEIPPAGQRAIHHGFNVTTALPNAHVVELDCDRLLGGQPQNPPRIVQLDILALAMHVRDLVGPRKPSFISTVVYRCAKRISVGAHQLPLELHTQLKLNGYV